MNLANERTMILWTNLVMSVCLKKPGGCLCALINELESSLRAGVVGSSFGNSTITCLV